MYKLQYFEIEYLKLGSLEQSPLKKLITIQFNDLPTLIKQLHTTFRDTLIILKTQILYVLPIKNKFLSLKTSRLLKQILLKCKSPMIFYYIEDPRQFRYIFSLYLDIAFIFYFNINYTKIMIDKALGLGTPKKEAFYFVFYINSISKNNAGEELTEAKFYIYKGLQLFNQTREPIHLNWKNGTARVDKCQLAFFLPDYSPNRKIDFILKMNVINELKEQEVDKISIDAEKSIRNFIDNNSQALEDSLNLGSYTINYQIFTERTRFGVEKIVKQHKDHREQLVDPNLETSPKSKNSPKKLENSNQVKAAKNSVEQLQDKAQQLISAYHPTQNVQKVIDKPKNKATRTVQYVKEGAENVQEAIKNQNDLKISGRIKPPVLQKLQKQRESLSPQPQEKKQQNGNQDPAWKVEDISSPHIGPWQQYAQKSGKLSSSLLIKKVEQTSPPRPINIAYNLKIIVFLILSLLLIYHVMGPNRKVAYKKKL